MRAAELMAKTVESTRENTACWVRVRFSRISIDLKRLDRARMLAIEAITPSFTSSENRLSDIRRWKPL